MLSVLKNVRFFGPLVGSAAAAAVSTVACEPAVTSNIVEGIKKEGGRLVTPVEIGGYSCFYTAPPEQSDPERAPPSHISFGNNSST